MAMGPGFNMLRACFFLLAIIIVSQVATTLAGGATCFYLFLMGMSEPGACAAFTSQVREIWAEALAVVLALLLAARGPDPPQK